MRAAILLVVRKNQMVQDQPPENGAAGAAEQPAQMAQTSGTDRHPPAEPRKPGEFVGWGSRRSAAVGRMEAADRENDAAGIGECVLVGAVDFGTFPFAGDGVEALSAEHPAFVFDSGAVLEGVLGRALLVGRCSLEQA